MVVEGEGLHVDGLELKRRRREGRRDEGRGTRDEGGGTSGKVRGQRVREQVWGRC